MRPREAQPDDAPTCCPRCGSAGPFLDDFEVALFGDPLEAALFPRDELFVAKQWRAAYCCACLEQGLMVCVS